MMTVVIYVNGTPVYARSAVNVGSENEKGETKYICDAGKSIRHKREDGAIELAKKMLDSIRDLK